MERILNTQNHDCLLDEVATQELQSALEQLAEKDLSDEARAFFLAELYIQYGQNIKATVQLEYLLRAENQFEVIHEKKEAVDIKLQQIRANFEATKEQLPNLLDEIKTLRSYNPCGQNGCPPNQRSIWSASRNTWICVGC